MALPQTTSYGSWKSPITSDLIVAGTVGLEQVAIDGADICWIEARPSEAGRNVIVRRTPDGRTSDMNPAPFNARTRVHEYGGGAFVAHDGIVYFTHFADQRLYRQKSGESPQPITPDAALRYADMIVDAPRGRLLCVREDHTVAGREAVNTLVSVPLDGSGSTQILVSGNDFYSSPRLSRDGRRLAWLAWNHPNMPWDGCELWVAEMNADGSLARSERVAGAKDESIFQPEWSPDGRLHFVSDRSGWWNLYRLDGPTVEPLCPMEAEFGQAQWVFRQSTYAFGADGQIYCAYTARGYWRLARLNASTRRLEPIEEISSELSWGSSLAGNADHLVFIAGSPTESSAVIRYTLKTGATEVLRRSSSITIDAGYLSTAEAIEFPTEHGLTAHAFYYRPRNPDHVAPAGEKPPLLVRCHGGPTGATSAELRLAYQYWTSRGIAILDVNYGGSTGYGRSYRQRLDGQWGVVDVDDCINGARWLVAQGLADGKRVAIRGGSAGGYTTLCALTFRQFFKAGASHYGVSDLEALFHDTHKFESRYDERLIGPRLESRSLYRERSPIYFADQLSCPVIFFQGLEDKVVPPDQAERMVAALRAKKLPVAYIAFEGEQHGFRRAENIKRALDGELSFYAQVFGFALADPVEPVVIER